MRHVLACTLTLAAVAAFGVSTQASIDLPPGYEAFDLGQLRDGESREFGRGAHVVTATRVDDLVTIRRPSADDPHAVVRCEVDRDHCSIGIPSDPQGRPLILVSKERECVNGVGDCNEFKMLIGDEPIAGAAYQVIVTQNDDCDDSEADCKKVKVVRIGGDGSDARVHVVTSGASDDSAVWVGDDGSPHALAGTTWAFATGAGAAIESILRCPEGDVTMQVAKEDADETFVCPKHNVALAKIQGSGVVIEKQIKKAPRSH